MSCITTQEAQLFVPSHASDVDIRAHTDQAVFVATHSDNEKHGRAFDQR